MKVSTLRTYLLIGVPLVVGSANAETINWYSPQKSNLTSSGQNMDAAFQFQLGVFTGGFIPTASNITRWPAYWVSAQASSYNAVSRAFESNFTVTGNVAPFSIGAKAYVWGRGIGSTKDEWILFRKSDWTWPAPNPMDPFGLDWNAAAANEVILGTIQADGNPFLMKSEAVFSFAQWSDATLAGEPLNGPNDDPDRDGVTNLLEFVFGTPPGQASATPSTPASFVGIAGQNYLQISIPRLRNRLATVTVEVSNDLINWSSGDTFTAEVSNTAEVIVVRDKTPTGPGLPARFMRLKAEIAP